MKSTFFAFFALIFLFSCKKEKVKIDGHWQIISKNVQYQTSPKLFKLKTGKFSYTISNSKLPYKKVILLNASLVGYFTELGLEDRIIGTSSPEYIFSPKLKKMIAAGKIENVGDEQKYNVEKIIALQPDVIFTNYVASFENTYDLLKKNNIKVIFLDEYLEQQPLQKSKYLIIIGTLLDHQKEAEIKYHAISESYDSLKKLAKNAATKPVVLANEMYGNQWFLPGGNSNLAQFIADSNAQYINASSEDEKAIPMSFEEVFSKSQNARFWINVGNHRNRKELLQINPSYSKMRVFNSGKLYTVSGKEQEKSNDYFESGVVRADLVLKDYIKIFHPELLPNYNLTYMKELK